MLLKEQLDARGFRFRYVSEKTGIPYNTLRHYIYETRPIPESKLRTICLTFGIDLKIFGLSDTYKQQEGA